MNAEQQDIRDFFFIVNKFKMSYHYDMINESMHIADDLDELAITIGDKIKEVILSTDFNNKEAVHQLTSDSYYTGFNFNTNYLMDILKNETKPEPVLQLDDESERFPIYYQLSANDSSQKANAIWREKELQTFDKVYIDVNISQFLNVSDIKVYYSLVSTIAHELQHMFDMYVVPEFNRLDKSIKNGLTISFKNDNNFNVNLKSYDGMLISALLGLCSPEEKNARLAELKMLMTLLKRNPELTDELFYETIRNDVSPVKYLEHENPVTIDELKSSVATNKLIQSVTRTNMFANLVYGLIKDKHQNRNHFNAVMLITGFYLYKHGLMDFQKDETGKQEMKRIMSNADTIRSIVDVGTMTAKQSPVYNIVCEIVHKTLFKNLDDYMRLVDNQLNVHMTVLYKYKKVSELFGDWYDGNDNEIILERLSIS